MINDLVGIPLPWTRRLGLRAEGRQRDELPLPQPLHREQQGAERRRVRPRSSASTRASRGSTRSRPTARATPTTRCRARSRTCPTSRRPTATSAQPAFSILGPADPRRLALRVRLALERQGGRARHVPARRGPDALPAGLRHNGNDSHWLSNPEEPLTGFDRIIGIEEAERTLRTRLGLIQVEDRLAGTDGLPGNRFNRTLLQKVARRQPPVRWASCGATASSRCARAAPGGFLLGSSGPVDVSGACEPLKNWDLHDDLDSNGAIRLPPLRLADPRRLHDAAHRAAGRHRAGQRRRSSRRRSRSPTRCTRRAASTPTNPLVQRALADAVSDLEGAGIPLDAPLRGHQYEHRGGADDPDPRRARHARASSTRSTSRWDPEKDGYGDVKHGSSFMMAAQFVAGKCPVRAGTFVTYSQSENQRSKHARRLHARVLAEALEPRAVLPARRPAEDALDEAGHRREALSRSSSRPPIAAKCGWRKGAPPAGSASSVHTSQPDAGGRVLAPGV